MKKSSFQRTILNVSLSFLLILISVFPGFPQNFTSGVVYRLTARHNGQVLDVLNAGRDNQADVFIHPWTGGAHQQWKFENLGDGSYRLIAMHSGKVLDVNFNTANQANVVQHDWHGGDNQRWIFEPVGDGYYKVIAKFSRKVLDVNLSDKPGNVVQHEWHRGDNQRWKVEIVSSGMEIPVGIQAGSQYRLIAKHNGQVLDVLGAGLDNQADVFVHAWEKKTNQIWRVDALGDGSFKLTVKHSGKVLDVNNSMANQANVVQHEWHGGDNQRWIFEPLGDGYYKVIAKFSGKVLDVNLSDKPGNVVQHQWHGGDNQRWKLEIVDGMTVTVPVNTGSGAVDLTGSWQDDRGGRYQIRQEDGRIWWYVEKIPELSGVFRGTLSGSTISGDWVDLPGAQRREKGSLTLRVVSKDRLEKISSSGPFNASVLTRR